MEWTSEERSELSYITRKLPRKIWHGPEDRGEKPMHEIDATVYRYMAAGMIKKLSGGGYEVTDKCRKMFGR
jgi:hypothetical protein